MGQVLNKKLFASVSDKGGRTRLAALTVPELPDVGVVLFHDATEPAPPEESFVVKSDVLYLHRKQVTCSQPQEYNQVCSVLMPVISNNDDY